MRSVEGAEMAPILVVEDDDVILSTLEFLLVEDGYTVTLASNGKEALEQAERHPPCLILLDMKMPVMDGWAFVAAYRERPGPYAPVIVMTAAQDARSRAQEIGADGLIAKPFDIDRLLDIVHRFAPR